MRPSDTVARLGGDEFMILCPDLGAEREAVVIAERLSGGLAEALLVDGFELYVGASIGIAFGHCRRSPEALIRDADQTMYRAKERGSRYELFEPGVGRRPARRPGLETELRQALKHDELRLVYQPELDCGYDRIFGVEALLRWRHPHRGVVAPGDFISLAEETGLIVPIGEWVISEATRQLADWGRAGICDSDLTMSVNISPRQLVDGGLPAAVRSALDANDLPPERLCLELTESTVAADPVRVLARLEELKALGVSLSVDDFGTGHSSLSVLSGYPLDTLKVDRSFVAQLSGGLKHRRLFASVVGVAHALGIRALAEGRGDAGAARRGLRGRLRRRPGLLRRPSGRGVRPRRGAPGTVPWCRGLIPDGGAACADTGGGCSKDQERMPGSQPGLRLGSPRPGQR